MYRRDLWLLAGLSGRRVLLFQRHRMGGGGRRHHGCRCCATGWPRCSARARASAMAVFLAQAHRAPREDDRALREIAELAAAFGPRASASSRPRRRAAPSSRSRGGLGLRRARRACGRRGGIAYPVAVGVVSAAHDGALAPAMHAFLHAGVELDFRRRAAGAARADRQPAHFRAPGADVAGTAARAAASLDDLGSATFRADLASLRHETQYTRLFRS